MINGVYYSTVYQQLQQQLKLDGDMIIIVTEHGLYLSFFYDNVSSLSKSINPTT